MTEDYSKKLAEHDRIFNGALEQAAIKLKQWYPDNEQTNGLLGV